MAILDHYLKTEKLTIDTLKKCKCGKIMVDNTFKVRRGLAGSLDCKCGRKITF